MVCVSFCFVVIIIIVGSIIRSGRPLVVYREIAISCFACVHVSFLLYCFPWAVSGHVFALLGLTLGTL